MTRSKSIFLFFLTLTLISCSKDETHINSESYRYELWKMFIDNEWEVDFVGTRVDLGGYPNYLGQPFDIEHEGVSGIQTEGVLSNIDAVLENIPTPDVVLLGVGGNDLLFAGDMPSDVTDNIDEIIDVLQDHIPNVTIFVEAIAPPAPEYMTPNFSRRLNRYHAQVFLVAMVKSEANAPVITVDMSSGFKDFYLVDGLHYNKLGARFVANNYFEAIQEQFESEEKLTILTLGDSRVEGNRK